MSQVSFKAGPDGTFEVMAGWDRPCQEFYLTVFDAEEEVVWSTLGSVDPGLRESTLFIRTQLTKMTIQAPDGFWERVERREANVVHKMTPAGWKTYNV